MPTIDPWIKQFKKITNTDGFITITENFTDDPGGRTLILNLQGTILDNTGLVLTDIPCDPTVFVKAAVRMDAAGVAFNAIADALATSNVIGICQAKSSTVLCDIRVSGVTPALFTGLDTTQEYLLSDTIPGEITITVPTGLNHVVLKLGQPLSSTEFTVHRGTSIELEA